MIPPGHPNSAEKSVHIFLMQVKTYNQSGEETGTVELADSVFGLKWNADLMYQVVTSQEANMRHPIANVKDRAQVRGGGKKPWRQKGTGRARHGSIRSPIWKGGGVTHGPTKDKNFKKKINKKMARKALWVALSAKVKDGEIVVLDSLSFPEGKTKNAATMFAGLTKTHKNISKKNGALVALARNDVVSKRAMRNLPYAAMDEARNLNAWEVLQYKYVIFPKDAVSMFGKATAK